MVNFEFFAVVKDQENVSMFGGIGRQVWKNGDVFVGFKEANRFFLLIRECKSELWAGFAEDFLKCGKKIEPIVFVAFCADDFEFRILNFMTGGCDCERPDLSARRIDRADGEKGKSFAGSAGKERHVYIFG